MYSVRNQLPLQIMPWQKYWGHFTFENIFFIFNHTSFQLRDFIIFNFRAFYIYNFLIFAIGTLLVGYLHDSFFILQTSGVKALYRTVSSRSKLLDVANMAAYIPLLANLYFIYKPCHINWIWITILVLTWWNIRKARVLYVILTKFIGSK